MKNPPKTTRIPIYQTKTDNKFLKKKKKIDLSPKIALPAAPSGIAVAGVAKMDDDQDDLFRHVNPNLGYSLDLDRAMGAVRSHEEKTGTRYDVLRQDPHFGASSECPPETLAHDPPFGSSNQWTRFPSLSGVTLAP